VCLLNQEGGFMRGQKLHHQKLGEVVVAPKNAALFAADAVESVKKFHHIALDYSVGSLRHIDKILQEYHAEGVTVDGLWLTLFFYGCYAGEVIVRNNRGARWISLPDDSYESELDTGMVVQLASGTVVNPIGKAEKRLLNGEIDSLESFYEAFVEDDPGLPKPKKKPKKK
jgi:hypothetical protein